MAGAILFAMTAPPPAWGDPAGSAYTGVVTSVDLNAHTLEAKGILLDKKFILGANFNYVPLNRSSTGAQDLRPGEKVSITYENQGGNLVARRIEQIPMCFEGIVKDLDPVHHLITVHIAGLDKTFQIAKDCGIELRNQHPGSLGDLQVGNHVTVTYETPDEVATAEQIAQTSETFTGTVTAVDLQNRTVEAETLLDTKKFSLANDCTILANGKPGGRLTDLKPDDKLIFSYDEINGINVANRIVPQGDLKSNPLDLTGSESH